MISKKMICDCGCGAIIWQPPGTPSGEWRCTRFSGPSIINREYGEEDEEFVLEYGYRIDERLHRLYGYVCSEYGEKYSGGKYFVVNSKTLDGFKKNAIKGGGHD